MNKHTPGPWSIKHENGDINIVSDAVPYVAQVFTCPAVEVMDNARLIAAAPDLLKALRHMIYALEDNVDDGDVEDIVAVKEARAAIAKATQ